MKTFLANEPGGATLTMQCIACDVYFTEFDIRVDDAGKRDAGTSFANLVMNDSPTTRQLENMNDSFNAGVQILAGRSRLETRFERDLQTVLMLDVRNLGIYDKSKTTECTDDPDLIFRMPNHPDCDDRGFLKAIVKKCGCVPFTEKKHWREFEASKGVVNLPFCTMQHYYNCSEEVGPIKIDECLPSCNTIRNQYTLSIVQADKDVDRNKIVTIFFTSADHSFVIYEDRYQLTAPQFVSQLGGDIGLYTGLSMLGLWQFVVFMYNRYKIYNDRYFRTHPNLKRKSLKYFRGFIGELLRSIETFITKLPGNDDDGAKKAKKESNAVVPTGSQIRRISVQLEASVGGKIEKMEEATIGGIRSIQERMTKMEKEISQLENVMRSKFEEILSLMRNSTDKDTATNHPHSPNDSSMAVAEL